LYEFRHSLPVERLLHPDLIAQFVISQIAQRGAINLEASKAVNVTIEANLRFAQPSNDSGMIPQSHGGITGTRRIR
jgi:hypothetical protein